MDCRGARVVQTTSWARIAVVASMAPMAPMASMVASMAPMDLVASMASIVAAPMEPMVSLVQRFGAHLLHPAHCIKPFGLLLVRGPHPDATPRESVRSRSLRRVEKLMECELMGLAKLVKSELKGCLTKLWRKVMMEKLRKNW